MVFTLTALLGITPFALVPKQEPGDSRIHYILPPEYRVTDNRGAGMSTNVLLVTKVPLSGIPSKTTTDYAENLLAGYKKVSGFERHGAGYRAFPGQPSALLRNPQKTCLLSVNFQDRQGRKLSLIEVLFELPPKTSSEIRTICDIRLVADNPRALATANEFISAIQVDRDSDSNPLFENTEVGRVWLKIESSNFGFSMSLPNWPFIDAFKPTQDEQLHTVGYWTEGNVSVRYTAIKFKSPSMVPEAADLAHDLMLIVNEGGGTDTKLKILGDPVGFFKDEARKGDYRASNDLAIEDLDNDRLGKDTSVLISGPSGAPRYYSFFSSNGAVCLRVDVQVSDDPRGKVFLRQFLGALRMANP